MEPVLREKLHLEKPAYSQEEIDWLLNRIGDSSADIRDGLVYQTFCKGIGQGLFSMEQYEEIVQWAVRQKVVFEQMESAGEATLVRSFTALLYALLLWADGEGSSLYHKRMSEEQVIFLIEIAMRYVFEEKDDRAFDEKVGWVHGIAHGADLLMQASLHPLFSSDAFDSILEKLALLFQGRRRRFLGDEEMRLAAIVLVPMINMHLPVTKFVTWLGKLNFPLETERDIDCFLSFRLFLLTLYVELDRHERLSREDKTVFFSFLDRFQ